MFDFAKIRQTITSLAGELKKLRAEREALLQKREDLEGAPACKEDLLQLLDSWIDRRGADFPAKLEAGVDYYRRHPLLNLPESAKAPAHPMAILTAVADPNGMTTFASFEASLFYLLGDAIKGGDAPGGRAARLHRRRPAAHRKARNYQGDRCTHR